ncbi:LETM1-related biofilm-associated protein [uncultured Maribacter sp.]|uniref:LETM1-related biofilm-associated protein n=1 Tax=uncultured Maribacter sp. TaxID=431308 RepID=UPI002626BE77|nr:LETM1-related biofilm-associated protein [uncultured Maribacter sp.]
MNPSSLGWIGKYFHLIKDDAMPFSTFRDLYGELKKTGFVYGINIRIPRKIESEHKLTEDESAKINLLNALYYTYVLETEKATVQEFITVVNQFYTSLEINHVSFLEKLLTTKKGSNKLEKIIESRVYLEDNVLSKTFNSIITNSFLYIDVLTFKQYLHQKNNIREYAQNIEYIAINIIYHALNSKEKNKSDKKLAQLFESSLTFIDVESQNFDGSYRERILANSEEWENRYYLEMACLTVWEDKSLDYKESDFIFGIGKDLGFSTKQISRSIEEISSFFDKNSEIIPFLKDNNLAIQFYDSMSKIVNKLIIRNSKRLQKELSESKELVALLSKSTVKDLSSEEKKKVQNQLIDICKSVPSLAIFILPGGAVLLPIFIRLIPKLLPSSFDENRVE